MTKEEIAEIIALAHHKMHILNSCREFFPERMDLESINFVIEWLNLMLQDINSGVMPVFHYEKAKIEIESLHIDTICDTVEENVDSINRYLKINGIYKPFETIKKGVSCHHTYNVLRAIGFAQENCVIVGPNGCGKTTLANTFTSSITQSTGTVIPAQKLLIVPNVIGIPFYDEVDREYQTYQRSVTNYKQTYTYKNGDSLPYDIIKKYGGELQNVIIKFLADLNKVKDDVFAAQRLGKKVSHLTKIDEAKEIWNDLMQERQLDIDSQNNFVLAYEGKSYPAYNMSEGEREMLYLIGRVLFAPENGYIVVDEPEIYLHKTIVNKLWDKLEQKRGDCKFVYLTHDLDFASTRNAKKCWIKRYSHPHNWEIQELDGSEIPEELLLTLLGSRKKILFCEGTKGSLDIKIFEILFPEYTIMSVHSCKDVINYTKAYNKLPNRLSDAFGIVDRDFRTDEEIVKLKENNIITYDVSEIENLLLVEEFIKGFSSYSHLTVDIDDIKKRVFDKFAQAKVEQASAYITSRLNFEFSKEPIDKDRTYDGVKKTFDNFINHIDLEQWFKERITLIDEIISHGDYANAIKIFNNKGLHSIVSCSIGLKNYYSHALNYLKENKEAQEILRNLFPNLQHE